MQQLVENYVKHYQNKGVKLNNVSLGNFQVSKETAIPCLKTTQDISEKQVLIEIPKNLILNTKTAFFDPELHPIFLKNKEFFSIEGRVFEHLIMLVFLLKEESKGEKSDYYSWLQILRENEDHLLYWDEKDIDNLFNQSLKHEMIFQQKYLQEITNKIIKITSQTPELFDADVVNRKLIKKFFVLCITRCFNFEKYSGLVPVADLLNHDNMKAIFALDTDLKKIENDEKKQLGYKSVDSDNEDEDNEESKFFKFTEEQEQQKEVFKSMVEKFYEIGKDFEAMPEIKKEVNKINLYCQLVLKGKSKYSINKVIFILKLQINLTNKIQQMLNLNKAMQEQYSFMFLHDLQELYKKVQERIPFETPEKQAESSEEEKQLEKEFSEKFEIVKKQFISKFKQNQSLDINAESWPEEEFEVFNVYTQEPLKKDEQVFVSYSLQSNTNLLINYGMVLRDNEFSSFRFPVHIDSEQFKFILPNIHNTLLDKDTLKVKKTLFYKLKFPEFNDEILDAFRTYNTDIFSVDKIKNFGYITNLQIELKIIDELGNLYQQFLNNNNYQIEPEDAKQQMAEKPYRQQCIENYSREKLELVVQQIKYLQEIVSLIMILKQNQEKQAEIIQSYVPQRALQNYYEKLKTFILKPKEEEEEQPPQQQQQQK